MTKERRAELREVAEKRNYERAHGRIEKLTDVLTEALDALDAAEAREVPMADKADWIRRCGELERERDEARAEVERLRAALAVHEEREAWRNPHERARRLEAREQAALAATDVQLSKEE